MKVELETIDSVHRKLHITVPAEQLNSDLNTTMANLRKTAQIPGFRKNRVPLSILRQRYGKAAQSEVLQETVPDVCVKAIEDNDLTVVGDVTLDPPLDEMEFPTDGDLSFTLEVEVKPPLALPDYRTLEIDKASVNVEQDEVTETIDSLRNARAEYEDIEEERAAQEGDFLFISWRARIEGAEEPTEQHEDDRVELGAGATFDAVEEALTGMTVDEEKTATVTYPDDYPNEDLAGKATELDLTLKRITRKIMPELDDDFAKSLNYESVEQMRGELWNRMIESKKEQKRSEQRRDILEQLVEKTEFEVAEKALNDRKGLILQQHIRDLQRSGANLQNLDMESLDSDLSEAAERSIREEWIMDELAGAESVEVGEADVREHVREQAQSRGQDPERYEAALRETGRWDGMERFLRDERIFELLIEQASQKDGIITP